MQEEDLRSLPAEQKIGQLFFIGIPGTEVDAETRELIEKVSPGGVCLFARNICEADQIRRLLDDLRNALPAIPLLSIDQEGGLVDRLRRIVAPMPAANTIRTTERAAEFGKIVAETLLLLGFNMNFAPVVDVIDTKRAERPNGLYTREFGRSADDVIKLAGAFLDEMQKTGVIGCLKHFPGLGAAQVDSHEELPSIDISKEDFETTDLYPFRELFARGNVHSVMVAHAAFPASNLQQSDRNGKLLPASLSSTFIDGLLRCDLGFNGVVITDDLEMGAIVRNYGIGDACKMAINAGADMLAICADPKLIVDGFDSVSAAVNSGEISVDRIDQSLKRIGRLKSATIAKVNFDPARLDELSAQIADFKTRLA